MPHTPTDMSKWWTGSSCKLCQKLVISPFQSKISDVPAGCEEGYRWPMIQAWRALERLRGGGGNRENFMFEAYFVVFYPFWLDESPKTSNVHHCKSVVTTGNFHTCSLKAVKIQQNEHTPGLS